MEGGGAVSAEQRRLGLNRRWGGGAAASLTILRWDGPTRSCVFPVYNLVSLETAIHLQNHHHDLCQKQVHPLQKFPPTPFIITIARREEDTSRKMCS